MPKTKQSATFVIIAAIVFAIWEGVGHFALMGLPMALRHGLSIAISTSLALLLAASVARIILGQHRQLQRLARLRDYLTRMEAHYLRLPPGSQYDPLEHFESQQRRVAFVESLHDLASRSPATRARALIEIASTVTNSSSPPAESETLFRQASPHISAALYLERDSLVRAEALQAVRTLSDLAAERANHLLVELLHELAHANRASFQQFREALGSWRESVGVQVGSAPGPDLLRTLWQSTRLGESETTGLALLEELSLAEESSQSLLTTTEAPESTSPHARRIGRGLLSELSLTASCVRDTTAAIAYVVQKLPPPADQPSNKKLRNWRPARPIDLSRCFLANADLSGAHLEGADLSGAWLQESSLSGTHLTHADLSECRARGAHLYGADLRWARLMSADLTAAGLSSVNLEGADLSRAKLAAAFLVGVELREAILWGVEVDRLQAGQRIRATFERANWWDAIFRDPLTGREDKAIQSWLSSVFPRPTAEERKATLRSA